MRKLQEKKNKKKNNTVLYEEQKRKNALKVLREVNIIKIIDNYTEREKTTNKEWRKCHYLLC